MPVCFCDWDTLPKYISQNSWLQVGWCSWYSNIVQGLNPRRGQNFPHTYRPALGSTQPPVQCVAGLFPGGKVAEVWPWPPTPHQVLRLKKEYSYTSTPPPGLHSLLQGEHQEIWLNKWLLTAHGKMIPWTKCVTRNFQYKISSKCNKIQLFKAPTATHRYGMPTYRSHKWVNRPVTASSSAQVLKDIHYYAHIKGNKLSLEWQWMRVLFTIGTSH
jgi:hypothetical protein